MEFFVPCCFMGTIAMFNTPHANPHSPSRNNCDKGRATGKHGPYFLKLSVNFQKTQTSKSE